MRVMKAVFFFQGKCEITTESSQSTPNQPSQGTSPRGVGGVRLSTSGQSQLSPRKRAPIMATLCCDYKTARRGMLVTKLSPPPGDPLRCPRGKCAGADWRACAACSSCSLPSFSSEWARRHCPMRNRLPLSSETTAYRNARSQPSQGTKRRTPSAASASPAQALPRCRLSSSW